MAKKKMVKVTFKKSPTGAPFFLAYSKGQTGSVDAEVAKELLDAGFIETTTSASNRKTADKNGEGENRGEGGDDSGKSEPK